MSRSLPPINTGRPIPAVGRAMIAIPVLAGLLMQAGQAPGQVGTNAMLGFSEAGTRRERARERQIIGRASGARMLEYHRTMTAEPHHAGTEANERAGDYVAELLREFGFDEVILNRYEVLLPRPVHREVTLLAPQRYELRLAEPPYPEDPDSAKEGVLPPFNAYSADGDVTGDVVYVNYGIPEDYEVLDRMGISVQGKIVLARYGRSWRGIKPRIAAERGAIGCLIYSDPADDGFVVGEVIPDGKWRPKWGVQRGSVMDMPTYPGDPQTPGRPSRPGAERIPLNETPTLQKIPVLPISWGDALPILRSLAGEVVPAAWRGGLPLTYHVGPGPARVHMRLEFDWGVRPIVNVIGILRGSSRPERIVMAGGHRDAWTFGGRDPISGSVSLLETARLIGELARNGERSRRSIAIASWDAEEYGLIGSVEYGEEFGDQLQGAMVAYLNRESYTAGSFAASGVHALQPLVNEIVRDVRMPDDSQTVWENWAGDGDPARMVDHDVDGDLDVRLGALGSGSDYTVFLDHLGIASVNLGFSSGNGTYHSRYDTHGFFTRFGDPGFEHGQRLAEVSAFFLLRLANADVLPFDYAAACETIDRYLDELDAASSDAGLDLAASLAEIRAANRDLGATAVALNAVIRTGLEKVRGAERPDRWSRLNDLLLLAEVELLDAGGLPGRPWFRHQLYAPGFYTGYGVKTLPGVREAIEKGDADEAAEMGRKLIAALERVRAKLVEGIVAMTVAGAVAPKPQAADAAAIGSRPLARRDG